VAAFLVGALSSFGAAFAVAGHLPQPRLTAAAQPAPVKAAQARAQAPRAVKTPLARTRFATSWLDSHPSPELGTHMRSAVLVDLDFNQVLWAKDDRSRRPPASLTKLMTAMVVVDLAGLDDQVTVPAEASQVEPNWMGVSPGEVLTVGELLWGLLLDSGNDAAETLARTLMPRSAFLAEMNAKAAKLGMRDSHFANPSGLDDPGLYSTAYDLAIMAGHLLENYPVLAGIVVTSEHPVPATSTHKAFAPYNLNGLVRRYGGGTGLKTGYTDEAGGCLAASATRAGRRLVAIVLNSDIFVGDATRLLDYGFANQPGSRLPASP
jgi:D-alanyl-D-alanine carboxypeptidase (penicillin-binding protein 5/6)